VDVNDVGARFIAPFAFWRWMTIADGRTIISTTPPLRGTPPRRGIKVKINVKTIAVDVDVKIPRLGGVPPKAAGWFGLRRDKQVLLTAIR
jgi:hypothetical protein